MNTISLAISDKIASSINKKVTLGYRIYGEKFDGRIPALGELSDSYPVGSLFFLTFDLVDDRLSGLLPEQDSNKYEFGVDDNKVLKQVVVILSQEDSDKVADIVGVKNLVKVYTLDVKEFKTEGEKTMVEKTYKYKDKEYAVKDGELDEQIKAYALKNNVSYEQAFLTVSQLEKESEHE